MKKIVCVKKVSLLLWAIVICVCGTFNFWMIEKWKSRYRWTCDGIDTHASFAASGGKAIKDRIFVFGEFGYIPIGGPSASGGGVHS